MGQASNHLVQRYKPGAEGRKAPTSRCFFVPAHVGVVKGKLSSRHKLFQVQRQVAVEERKVERLGELADVRQNADNSLQDSSTILELYPVDSWAAE